MTSFDEALLLFRKWQQERIPITCTVLGKGVRVQIVGLVEQTKDGAIEIRGAEEGGSLHLHLHSVYEFKYCDPREITDAEMREQAEAFAGFLIARLHYGEILHFAEPA